MGPENLGKNLGKNLQYFVQGQAIAWDYCTQQTAGIGPDNHSSVSKDIDLFIICTLSLPKLPDHTQL